MKKYLLYVLVNYNIKYYIKMFKIFLKSLVLFSDMSSFDLMIITDERSEEYIKNIKELNKFTYDVLIRPDEEDLKHSLLRKFDIAHYEKFMDYSRILYIDIDVIVQKDIKNIFKSVPKLLSNTLYATKEGTLEGRYWYLNSYHESNIEKLKKEKIDSFNSGMFMFKPDAKMKKHFLKLKTFAENYYEKNGEKSVESFFDQSFMNYYFNINRLSNTEYMNEMYVMFPDTDKYYPNKTVLHIAGLGRYKEKSKIMNKYLKFIVSKK